MNVKKCSKLRNVAWQSHWQIVIFNTISQAVHFHTNVAVLDTKTYI